MSGDTMMFTRTASWNNSLQCQYGVCCEIWMALRRRGFAESTKFWKMNNQIYIRYYRVFFLHSIRSNKSCLLLRHNDALITLSQANNNRQKIIYLHSFASLTCWQNSSDKILAASNLTSSNWESCCEIYHCKGKDMYNVSGVWSICIR